MVDLLVLGGGVAGLSAALHAAVAGLDVAVLTKGELGHSATRYAQGGVAAALAPGDSPELHLSDTLAAGAGLCDSDAARILVGEGPRRVRELIDAGAAFDRTGDGEAAALALAREGGHSTARVVHAGGDATGAEIERALVAALDATGVDVVEGRFVVDLLVEHGRAAGVQVLDAGGRLGEVRARHTMLASGGAGQLFSVTTNPKASTGDGIAMALRAGVPVADVEFVQFHPTALHQPSMPRPLLSEALRGDGAVLRDDQGVAFMGGEHPLADLAPRDVVARAVASRLVDRGLDHLWLDATAIPGFDRRFPTIWRACREAGLDPTRDWLPVAPAAHYLSGGVVTDLTGATALPGLWAVGEVACTGVHGANRLASNSLLEGLVFAPRAVAALLAGRDTPEPTGAMHGLLFTIEIEGTGFGAAPDGPARAGDTAGSSGNESKSSPPGPRPSRTGGIEMPGAVGRPGGTETPGAAGRASTSDDLGLSPEEEVRRPATAAPGSLPEVLREMVQRAMTNGAGVVRDEAGLRALIDRLDTFGGEIRALPMSEEAGEVGNLVAVGRALCTAAIERKESRGSHARAEYPEASLDFRGRLVHGPDGGVSFVPLDSAERPVR